MNTCEQCNHPLDAEIWIGRETEETTGVRYCSVVCEEIDVDYGIADEIARVVNVWMRAA